MGDSMSRPWFTIAAFSLIPTIQTFRFKRGIPFFAISSVFFLFNGCGPKIPSSAASGAATTSALVTACIDTIAIGFYNVENLFDLQFDGNEYPEYRPGALGWDKQMQAKKLANIGSVITAMRVTIIGLCEIESREALEALRKELGKGGVLFPYCAMAESQDRANTAPCLLSMYPLKSVNQFGPGGSGIRRQILEVDVDCGGNDLKIFVNHWPSKKHLESQRLALAQALRERIDRIPKAAEYVIMGDFNEGYDCWNTLHTEKLDDTKGRTGINHELGTIIGEPGRFAAYVMPQDFCSGTIKRGHFDPWVDVPEPKRWSLIFRGAPQTLDHILMPAAMFDSAGFSYGDKSFEPFTWNGALLRDGAPFRWQMKWSGKRRFHAGAGYSDHLPVRTVLYRRPYSCTARPPAAAPRPVAHDFKGGFEESLEGWMACGKGFSVTRDSLGAFAGRFCLHMQRPADEKNDCAARVVLDRGAINAERRMTVSFAIRGSGKLSVRLRSGNGTWRYYNGPSFTPANSARYLPVALPAWKTVSLPFTSDMPGSPDFEIELRAGKEAAFDFWVDEVKIIQ
jgi:endonuclease/exonuclease/phosphatase family metal-dependent hydrolase